jgi:hypothetical protein
MARMYGGNRRYLRRMMRRYTILALLSTAALAVIAGIWLWVVIVRTLPLWLVGGPLPLAAVPVYFSWRRRGYRYGIRGEEAVSKALSALGNRHRVFNGLTLPGVRGDIDHVVVGPGGVFALETKNYAGEITCAGDRWARRRNGKWEEMERSPGKQATDNARRLTVFLEGCRVTVKVNPVVVLAGRNVRIRARSPAVPVVERREIASYLAAQQDRLSAAEIRIISKYILDAARVG